LLSALDFIKKYFKFYIIIIPIFISWVTYLMFKKSRYNYPEHIVINAFIFSIILFLPSIIGIVFKFTDKLESNSIVLDLLETVAYVTTIVIYPSICIYQTYRYFYTKKQMIVKIILTNIFSLATIFLIFVGSLIIALLYSRLMH
jgi:hypothetical protein